MAAQRYVVEIGKIYGTFKVLARDDDAFLVVSCVKCGALSRKRANRLHAAKGAYCGDERCLRAPRRLHEQHKREYRVWASMKQRCLNVNDAAYADYGGRGIGVCDRWQNSFSAFFEDMGPCPAGLQLDRVDNNGHYEPNNCRWTTRSVQARNTRQNRSITYAGKTQTLAEWAAEKGLDQGTLFYRLKRGWSIERALTERARERSGNA